jgi:hypothetical protein
MDAKHCLGILTVVVSFFILSLALTYASGLDESIESAARDSYTFKNYLKDDKIKVKAKDGVVTLSGTVADDYHRLLATDTVSNLPGVKGVEDKLEVVSVGCKKAVNNITVQ